MDNGCATYNSAYTRTKKITNNLETRIVVDVDQCNTSNNERQSITVHEAQVADLPTEPPCQKHVLYLDRDALCVDGGHLRVFKKLYEIRFGRLLEGEDRGRLEAYI